MHRESRFVIGIDLGTTNIVVSYCDLFEKKRGIRIFNVPQFVAPGEILGKDIFPAFCFFPEKKLIGEGLFTLPWEEHCDFVLGYYARDAGAGQPSRFISSVKSWLCHSGVSRREKILPWGMSGREGNPSASPLETTMRYLSHIRKAWDMEFSNFKDSGGSPCVLSRQQIVITVPASFDETARELTLEAAAMAGFGEPVLLEEPLAAFYAWLSQNESRWENEISPGEKILVVDIGGGTCDFSIISLGQDGVLSRSSAGDHLLLGGDNMDIAIAKEIEKKWQTHLAPPEWAQLCQQCRHAKEKILGENLDKAEIVVLSRGSSVVASMKKAQILSEQLLSLVLDGFFPEIASDSPRSTAGGGIRSMGLPYVSEPAVTKHLLDFLRDASLADSAKSQNPLRPDKILFNGGVMLPAVVRQRMLGIMRKWFTGSDLMELPGADFIRAVARGAVYSGLAKRGEGIKIKSGTSRSYFIEAEFSGDIKKYICVMPRGIDENEKQEISGRFILKTNQKVVFPLYSRIGGAPGTTGEIIEFSDDLHPVSNLVSVIRHGKGTEKEFPCEMAAELSETGILRIWLENKAGSETWPLHFDLRSVKTEASGSRNVPAQTRIFEKGKMVSASETILQSFPRQRIGDEFSLFKALEKTMGVARTEWSIFILREFADLMLDRIPPDLMDIPGHETRWLSFSGFCLRPGFGEASDEIRIKKVWKLWYRGIRRRNDPRTACEWWIFWRRVAPGLGVGHQKTIAQALIKILCPEDAPSSSPKSGRQAKAEMWKCLASLELLPIETKIRLSGILLSKKTDMEDFECWALSRLASRRLFKANAEYVLPSEKAAECCSRLLSFSSAPSRQALFALSRIASLSGDRALDLPPETRMGIRSCLEKYAAPAHWIMHLDSEIPDSEEEQAALLGESLPSGIKLG